jgi:hypothetical protein
MISVTNFNQILLLLFVISGVIFVMYALATGKMDVEGQDDPAAAACRVLVHDSAVRFFDSEFCGFAVQPRFELT